MADQIVFSVKRGCAHTADEVVTPAVHTLAVAFQHVAVVKALAADITNMERGRVRPPATQPSHSSGSKMKPLLGVASWSGENTWHNI